MSGLSRIPTCICSRRALSHGATFRRRPWLGRGGSYDLVQLALSRMIRLDTGALRRIVYLILAELPRASRVGS